MKKKNKNIVRLKAGDDLVLVWDLRNQIVWSTDNLESTLSKEHIMQGFKEHIPNLIDCLSDARKKKELKPGHHTLFLNWDIQADGSVKNGELIGPAEFLETSFPKCLSERIKFWRFPKSKNGAPVRNFPFGPFNVK